MDLEKCLVYSDIEVSSREVVVGVVLYVGGAKIDSSDCGHFVKENVSEKWEVFKEMKTEQKGFLKQFA